MENFVCQLMLVQVIGLTSLLLLLLRIFADLAFAHSKVKGQNPVNKNMCKDPQATYTHNVAGYCYRLNFTPSTKPVV